MKSTKQIATDCNLTYDALKYIIKREEIIPAKKENKRNFYNKWQEEYIHSVLCFAGLLKEITVESKINDEVEDTCLICEHRQEDKCHSKRFQFCGLRKSNKTKNKLLQIKSNDAACALFEEKKI
ncbi:MAG: hypothetical protein H7Y10_03655 [Flavobacterium sp.]|nr:hypothetical protein [Flavobacterium sp.]